MIFNKISKIYRKIVPESIRIQIRNIQYVFDDLKFLLRQFYFNLKKSFNKNVNKYTKSVCYIIPTSQITGGVAVVCEHLNRLKKLGYKTLIVSYDNKTDLSWFPNQKVEVIPLKGNKKIIEKYNTVVATGWITAYELLLVNVKRKIYFVQSDETRFYPKGSYLKIRVKRTYSFSFEFITIAKWLQIWLKENFNKNSLYVPNGINTEIFYPDTPLKPKLKNKKRILLEGAINLPFKGMAEAFEVVKDLDCEVWCVSNDGKPKPEWRCDKFFERVPMDRMRRIYSSCDVLLKLSKVEGFFGPPLEMMACGGIPVVSKVTGYDEYIIDEYNAIVVSCHKTEAISKLKTILKNTNSFKKFNKNIRKTVKQMSWSKTIQKLDHFYSF